MLCLCFTSAVPSKFEKITIDKLKIDDIILNEIEYILIKSGGGERPYEARQPVFYKVPSPSVFTER